MTAKAEPRIFVLDTSALLVHFRVENGCSAVGEILRTPESIALISAISWLEFQVRLSVLVRNASVRAEALRLYRELVNRIEPVTEEISNRAMALRASASGRLPNADALIAATAVKARAVLVHCDPHFDQIPAKLMASIRLH